MDEGGIRAALRRLGVPHHVIGDALKVSRDSATRLMSEDRPRRIRVDERQPLLALIAKYEEVRGDTDIVRQARKLEDDFEAGLVGAYVAVEVLPTYAGMGGGGTGEGDRQMALLPRSLVEDELRAKPEDLLVINVRGNSMQPVFCQDDQILIDRRDRDVQQPGPFAIRYVGDEGWVLKNVERVPRTDRLRIWSENTSFGDREEEAEYIEIAGRPVWFARRV